MLLVPLDLKEGRESVSLSEWASLTLGASLTLSLTFEWRSMSPDFEGFLMIGACNNVTGWYYDDDDEEEEEEEEEDEEDKEEKRRIQEKKDEDEGGNTILLRYIFQISQLA